MVTWHLSDILSAKEDGGGFCLSCGSLQVVVETRPAVRGPCEVCYRPDVLPAEDVLRALALVEAEED